MSRKTKLYEKLRNSPHQATFEDVDQLLRWSGFELRRITGAHHIYKRQGYDTLVTVPHHKPLKAVYVKKVLTLFEMYYNFEEEN